MKRKLYGLYRTQTNVRNEETEIGKPLWRQFKHATRPPKLFEGHHRIHIPPPVDIDKISCLLWLNMKINVVCAILSIYSGMEYIWWWAITVNAC